jgi:hypothetical protein
MKVLVPDGIGAWLAARRLKQRKFHGQAFYKAAKCSLIPSSSRPWYSPAWQRVGAVAAIDAYLQKPKIVCQTLTNI